jgi:6-pyruvoyltetrahydropterin/6-carboxytetrahydropterin synthase
VEATFAAQALDRIGRVVDFGVIREKLGGWIDAHWDHAAILHEADRALGAAIAKETGQEVFYLPDNPTAENLARYLKETVCPQLFAGLSAACTRIRVYETPNCYADASS